MVTAENAQFHWGDVEKADKNAPWGSWLAAEGAEPCPIYKGKATWSSPPVLPAGTCPQVLGFGESFPEKKTKNLPEGCFGLSPGTAHG